MHKHLAAKFRGVMSPNPVVPSLVFAFPLVPRCVLKIGWVSVDSWFHGPTGRLFFCCFALPLGSERVDGSELRYSCCLTGDPAKHIDFGGVGQGVGEGVWNDLEDGVCA